MLFLYFCGTCCTPMDEKNTPEMTKVKSARKPLFIIGLVFGILLGTVLTMFVVNWFHYRLPKNVQVNNVPPRRETSPDTVVKYVIHKYECEPNMDQMVWNSDTSSVDSLYLEDVSEDLMLDEEAMAELEQREQQVQPDQMLWKKSMNVVYLNNDKDEVDPADDAIAILQVQGWGTPIKNKMTYWFSGSTLKLKGITKDAFKIYHYKNEFLLVVNHRVFSLHHNKQYEKLVETHTIEL